MRDDTTDTSWAASWLTASGGDFFAHGERIRSYGKDANGHLVAVRTDSGTYPVRNLPAVLFHAKMERALNAVENAEREEDTAWDRAETDYCERGTFACSVRHTRDSDCATW